LARRNDDTRLERKERAPQTGAQDQELEQEGPELEAPKPEHARLQDQLGNAAIAAMLGVGGAQGGIGIEVERERISRKMKPEKSTPELGGDDDPVGADGPLLLDDVTHAWQPRAKKGDDTLAFVEPMPDDALPPEDPDYLAALPGTPPGDALPPASGWDSLVQPSVDAVRLGLHDWAVAALRWAPDSPSWRVLARLAERGLPILQDPWGRVTIARGRMAAIALSGLVAGPALAGAGSPARAAVLDFCVELEARAHRVRTVAAIQQNEEPHKLPLARDVFLGHAPLAGGRLRPSAPSEAAAAAIEAVLTRLAGLPDPTELVPNVVAAPAEEEDDPLGLDAFLRAETGGAADPEAGAHELVVLSAERLAAACAGARIRLAAVCVAIAEAALEWSAGAPVEVLDARLIALDEEIAGVLSILVEVARAAQRRSVGLDGLRNGLRRAARALRRVERRAIGDLVAVVGGVIPQDDLGALPLPSPIAPLDESFDVGEPARALAWARALPDPLERRTAAALLALADTVAPDRVLAELVPAAAAWRGRDPHLARALAVIVGAAHLLADQADAARAVAATLRADGVARRSGALLAEAALLEMGAWRAEGQLSRAEQARRAHGATLWRMGARGPLSLLARWRPPVEEDEDDPVLPGDPLP
jgi:hypothetical protein